LRRHFSAGAGRSKWLRAILEHEVRNGSGRLVLSPNVKNWVGEGGGDAAVTHPVPKHNGRKQDGGNKIPAESGGVLDLGVDSE
jgi:hypothetical protein